MSTAQTCDLGTAVCLCLRMLVSTRLGGIIHVYPPNMWSRHCCLPVPKKACFNKTLGNYPWLPPKTCDLGTAVCLCPRKLVSTKLWVKYPWIPLQNMWSRHCRLSVPKKACFNKTRVKYPWIPLQTCDLGTAVCLCLRKLVSTKLGWSIHNHPPNMWSRHCRLSVPKNACFNKNLGEISLFPPKHVI